MALPRPSTSPRRQDTHAPPGQHWRADPGGHLRIPDTPNARLPHHPNRCHHRKGQGPAGQALSKGQEPAGQALNPREVDRRATAARQVLTAAAGEAGRRDARSGTAGGAAEAGPTDDQTQSGTGAAAAAAGPTDDQTQSGTEAAVAQAGRPRHLPPRAAVPSVARRCCGWMRRCRDQCGRCRNRGPRRRNRPLSRGRGSHPRRRAGQPSRNCTRGPPCHSRPGRQPGRLGRRGSRPPRRRNRVRYRHGLAPSHRDLARRRPGPGSTETAPPAGHSGRVPGPAQVPRPARVPRPAQPPGSRACRGAGRKRGADGHQRRVRGPSGRPAASAQASRGRPRPGRRPRMGHSPRPAACPARPPNRAARGGSRLASAVRFRDLPGGPARQPLPVERSLQQQGRRRPVHNGPPVS